MTGILEGIKVIEVASMAAAPLLDTLKVSNRFGRKSIWLGFCSSFAWLACTTRSYCVFAINTLI